MKTEADAANNYQAFMMGYRHGVCLKSKDPQHMEHVTLRRVYLAGYDTGASDAGRASSAASERFGYTPSILR